MNKTINTLGKYIQELDKLNGFITKTKDKSDKFSESVIAKLIIEFEIKQDTIKDDAEPLANQLQARSQELSSSLSNLQHSNSGNDEKKQELDLRLEIGALDKTEYDSLIGDIQESFDGYSQELEVLQDEISSINEVLSIWKKYGELNSPPEELSEESEESEESEVSEEIPPPPPVQAFETLIPEVELSFDDDIKDAPDSDTSPPESEVTPSGFDSSPYGTLDVGEDLNFDLSDDNFGFEDSVEFSAELVAPDEFSASIELNSVEAVDEENEPRSAILLRDEGTDDETVFPFQGENYTIGRSAENNIQIKNDSKVSRQHCRLSKRSNQFYIQDLGSSNGTVVDGELIDERRLLGGEEVKVGETIFRFSIQ
jgi:hypothetical protein